MSMNWQHITPDSKENKIIQAMNKLFWRRDVDPWSYSELWSVSQVAARPAIEQELTEIEQFYTKSPRKYLPYSVLRLLENWTGTLDRARMPVEKTEDELVRDRKAVEMMVPKLSKSYLSEL